MRGLTTPQFPMDCSRDPLGSLAQRRFVEMGVAVGRERPLVSGQTRRDMLALAVHDRPRGGRR